MPVTAMSNFARTVYENKYKQGEEEWEDTARRVVEEVVKPYFPEKVEPLVDAICERKFLPGGRYLYAAGKRNHQVNNCLLLSVEDSREGWASLMQRATAGLMTGAGIGVVYSKLREKGAAVRGMGGQSTGPISLMEMVNEAGRHIMQGGSRRAAIWAGLHWNHPDALEFVHMKDWIPEVKALKEKDFSFPARMDNTNISVILDDDFLSAYDNKTDPLHSQAHRVYWEAVESMLRTGEPGFSIDVGANAGEHLRNACTELTSADDNDICNLGSLNLSRIESRDEFARLVELGTVFLLCGTLYSTLPYRAVHRTREKNRRLGLGLMGIYEWLATRGKPYAPDEELGEWLEIYEKSTDIAATYAKHFGTSAPVKTRAIAPTGTIGILAETTTGIEPMFGTAYKRRYLKGDKHVYQYVVEPLAKKFNEQGINPDDLDTAYDLANNPTRRLEFQSWVQQYVDHGISSTINLPSFDRQSFTPESFGTSLLKYLPHLRGITVYPDGARGGQPLTVVPFAEAVDWEGYEYEEVGNERACVNGVCGL